MRVCEKCGAENEDSAEICQECGDILRKTERNFLYAGIILVILFVIIYVITYYWIL